MSQLERASNSTILAVVHEDDQQADVRRRAVDHARRTGASVVLVDLDAAATPFESPVPTEWSADQPDEWSGDRMGPRALEAAGRAAVAREVRAAREDGVDAWAWLPEWGDAEAVAGYATREHAALVVAAESDRELVEGIGVPVDFLTSPTA